MTRDAFRKFFKTGGPAIIPVIHVLDERQAIHNAAIAMREGAHGVFLINHDFPKEDLVGIIRRVRERFAWLWLGVNFLGVTGKFAFPMLAELKRDGCMVDAYWADDGRIDERSVCQSEADEIAQARLASGWDGLYFGGTAFKKQREVAADKFGEAARIACRYMDAVTTSGIATGEAADLSKIETFRAACDRHPLAIASGVNVANVHLYAPLVDAILVATGINKAGDFYNIDPDTLRALLRRAREASIEVPK